MIWVCESLHLLLSLLTPDKNACLQSVDSVECGVCWCWCWMNEEKWNRKYILRKFSPVFMCLSCPSAGLGCWAQARDQFETRYLCLSWAAAEPLLPPATMRQMWNSTKILHFLHLKEMGNSEKCISTKLTLFSFHDLFSKQRIRNFCCADLNKSTIWRRAKWFCETLRLPKMWWDCCGWARISPIFLPTNNPDVATLVLMVSWRPGGSRQPTVWFVCLWFVGLLG